MNNVHPLRPRVPPAPGPEPLWREVIGEQLRAGRNDRDERIIDVAERAGIAPQYLSELERGLKDPSSEVLSAVSGALGMTVLEVTWGAARRLALRSISPTSDPMCLAA